MNRTGKTLHTFIVTTLVAFVFLQGCNDSTDDGPKTIIMGHAMHLAHPVSVAIQQMADNVAEVSDGQLQIEIYPTGQLGSEPQLLELIQIGTIGMTKVSAGSLENFVPEMRVFSLPYLFRDEEHMASTLWGPVGDELLVEGAKYRLRGLGYYDAGSRSLYTVNQPVMTPEDMEGLKIRVLPSAMATKLAKQLGASPTPIAYGELYTAFQGGIIDAAENNPPSFYTSRHYEVCEYYVINEHTTIPDVLVIGTHIWDNLTEQEQGWLNEAVDASIEYQRVLWAESVEESMSVVREAGVEILYPDKAPFREKLQPMYDEFEEDNPDLYHWVDQIREVE